jgi:hypothetical protein
MSYYRTKSTKRFSFDISRNDTSHKAGANTVTIATNPMGEGRYSYGGTQLTMTVREAQALRSFLNQNLDSSDSSSGDGIF